MYNNVCVVDCIYGYVFLTHKIAFKADLNWVFNKFIFFGLTQMTLLKISYKHKKYDAFLSAIRHDDKAHSSEVGL